MLPGGHAIYKLLDVNAVVRTGRIFCSGASNSSAPSVPPSDKPFSFVATEAQLDGFTSKVTDGTCRADLTPLAKSAVLRSKGFLGPEGHLEGSSGD